VQASAVLDGERFIGLNSFPTGRGSTALIPNPTVKIILVARISWFSYSPTWLLQAHSVRQSRLRPTSCWQGFWQTVRRSYRVSFWRRIIDVHQLTVVYPEGTREAVYVATKRGRRSLSC
jgi:hypothetical protein